MKNQTFKHDTYFIYYCGYTLNFSEKNQTHPTKPDYTFLLFLTGQVEILSTKLSSPFYVYLGLFF